MNKKLSGVVISVIALTFILASLLTDNAAALAPKEVTPSNQQAKTATSAGQVGSGKLPRRVPRGKTYVYFDDKGTELARIKAGQLARSRNITDCAQIPCPSTFGKDVICWKCVKRPSTVRQ